MKRRDFLTHTAGIASILATGSSRSEVTPCPPPLDGDATNCPYDNSPLEERTSALTSANTPVANVNYFRSEEGSPQIPNNRTTQTSAITWQVEGIYYDANRRIMHQLDRQHNGSMEHAYYDLVNDNWVKVSATSLDFIAGHWRACDFDPDTGDIWYQKESTTNLHRYSASSGTWSTVSSYSLLGGNSDAGNLGFHPNLFGAGQPGILTGRYNPDNHFSAYNITTDTWYDLNQSGGSDIGVFLRGGWGAYLPAYDELIMTREGGAVVAFAAGAGLETNMQSTSSYAELRSSAPKGIYPAGGPGKCFACIHPRQPNVILAIDADNANVYYTTDGGRSPWVSTGTSGITHPFWPEFLTSYMTIGSLPAHGVVAGAASGSGDNNTKFVFWKPPLV